MNIVKNYLKNCNSSNADDSKAVNLQRAEMKLLFLEEFALN